MVLVGSRCDLPALLFAVPRLDRAVFVLAVGFPLVCLTVLILWNLLTGASRRIPRKPRPVRYSPEPPARERPVSELAPVAERRERLERASADLQQRLAEVCLELAAAYDRDGQPHRAVEVLERVIQLDPQSAQARIARDRLQQQSGAGQQPHS